jgi:hypothetical protein
MKLKIKIIIFAAILFFSVTLSAAPARAGMWGESIMAEEMGQMETAIQKIINGVIMGAAKQAAVKAIEGQISNIVSGGGSGTGDAMFVTNWQKYLFMDPAKKTELIMNDWFNSVSGGKSSSSNYSSASGSGDYAGQLIKQTKDALLNNRPPTINIQEFAKDPTQPFAEGNWRGFNALISNPVNNAFGLALTAQQEYLSKLEEEQQKANTKAIAAQGFIDTTDGGSGGGLSGSSGSSKEPTVTTPGIITKEIQANAENMSSQVMVNARDIPEVITALVTKLVTKTITQGIGKAAQNAQRSDSSTGTSGSQSNNSSFGIFGNFGQ